MRVRLPHRLSETLAVATAVLVGAVLASLCLVLLETGLRSPVPPQRLVTADLIVGGEQSVPRAEDLDVALPEHVGVPADLINEVAGVPGVAAAAGDLSFPAAVSDGAGGFQSSADPRRAGHGWDSLFGELALVGRPPAGAHDVVLDAATAATAGVSVGDQVEVALAGEPQTMRLTGVLDPTWSHAGIFVSDDLARTVASRAPGTVDLITATTEPGSDPTAVAERVQQVVGEDLVVSSGSDLGAAERPAAAATTGMLMLLVLSAAGVVVILVGFITGGAVSVMVANRARELALLRAIGATPAQVRSLMARQASAVALVAAVGGAALGHLLAWWAQDSLVGLGLLATGQQLSWSPWPALVTVLLLVGIVQVAARTASWRVSRLSATTAVVETEAEPRSGGQARTRIGAVLLALSLGTALAPLITRTEAAIIGAASGALLASIAVALIAPAVVRRLTRWLAPRQRTVSRWLAVRNSGSFALRTGGALAVLALAVGLTVTQIFATTTLSSVAAHEAREGTIATAQVTADQTGGVPASVVEEIEDLSSVSAAVTVRHTSGVRTSADGTQALVDADAQEILAVGPGVAEVLDLGVVDGDLADLVGDTVAVDASLAWPGTIEVGDTLPLALADGTRVEPTVVATYRHGFGFGQVVASGDLVSGGAGPYDSVLVQGPEAAAVDRDLTTLAATHPGLEASHPLTQEDSDPAALDPAVWINLGASVVLFGYILLGVANRLVATTLRRRREWQLLGALGATPRQVWAMVATETGLIALGATAAGLMIALVPMSLVALGFRGTPWPQGPVWVVATTVLVVTAAAYLATLMPTHHLVKSRGPLGPAG
ncbi:ABC transporter permease [Ornithinimicrobium faecis]|uniref:ABC transporter permease n=1 Tax=Ornithinimicrobium faecis TaxID=2934158 RepID=UPI002117FCD6|nr:FtsX-like permease family protein [Ornithinimicrobium sp. HY1745]